MREDRMNSVLIIDNDTDVAEIERDYLRAGGFSAEISPDGAEGLRQALTGRWQLVVLERTIPGADAFEICRRVCGETDIPVLIVTARPDDADRRRAMELGADGYIEKPFSPSALTARVRESIARGQKN